MSYKFISAEDAAKLIQNGDNIGFSGFTAAGSPKVVSEALAKRAEEEHQAGRPFKVGVFTGASTSDHLDGALARAHAIKFRTPYQSNKDLRAALNKGEAAYFDYHLSQLAQDIRYGFLGDIDIAVIEACDVTPEGEITLTSGVGNCPTYARLAKKIIIELNSYHPKTLRGIHDLYEPADPPYRREIPIYKPSDRIGVPTLKVDPAKIVGIVETHVSDGVAPFSPLDEVTMRIGQNVADFLAAEMKAGRIPSTFLPIQSGVGNIANAVLGCLGENEEVPPFEMYTEVIQDAVVGLMEKGRCKFASGCSLTLSEKAMQEVYAHMDFFRDKVVLRPQELSNNPEIVRRLGLITINTAIEADIFGNINSTHILGKKMMNGIGGSGDFTRNAYLSIFTTPSEAKGGLISSIVPMVSHLDHSEHSVKVIITEYGVADLRGKSPIQRANEIIEKVAHPDYRPLLRDYIKMTQGCHTPECLQKALSFHIAFEKEGDMRKADLGTPCSCEK